MNRVIAHNGITTQYRSELGVLIVRWLSESDIEDIISCYETIMSEAIRFNCARWLVDVRRRNYVDQRADEWYRETYLPRLSAAFPQGVRAAFVLSPMRLAAMGLTDEEINHCGIYGNHSMSTFSTEDAAMVMLRMP